jgi:antitoxin (DNA-binding transcriptional repressor) of toxin-antitoxin stability system
MKNVEEGESYEVMRYSRPIAIITPKKDQKADMPHVELSEKLDKILELMEKK